MAENTILVVDDEQRMRKLVRDFLTKQDFTVLEGYHSGDSGCHDAKDGRLADLPGDPSVFQGSDHYADSPRG